MNKSFLVFALLSFLLFACAKQKGFDDLATYSENGNTHFVVMNSAGTVENFIFDNEQNAFKVRTEEGRKEQINFLPFPANYGLIPSTHSEGLDKGELLYGFLISRNFNPQTLIEIVPVGGAKIISKDKSEDIVFSIPIEEQLRISEFNPDFGLPEEYKKVFEIWYSNAYQNKKIEKWYSAEYAEDLIKKRSNR